MVPKSPEIKIRYFGKVEETKEAKKTLKKVQKSFQPLRDVKEPVRNVI